MKLKINEKAPLSAYPIKTMRRFPYTTFKEIGL